MNHDLLLWNATGDVAYGRTQILGLNIYKRIGIAAEALHCDPPQDVHNRPCRDADQTASLTKSPILGTSKKEKKIIRQGMQLCNR